MKTSWRLWAPVALAVVSGAVFLNALGGQFVWDDRALIVDNPAIRAWANLPGFFTHSFVASFGAGAAAGQHESYRPLVSVTLLLDYKLWGLSPFGWHLTNLLMHVAATLAVYWTLLALWPASPIALLGGLLFGLHPVHSEAVAFVANRPELVCGFFFVLSAGAFIRFRKGGRSGWLAAALLLFAASLLSKETALVLPLALLAYDLTFWSNSHRRARYWWPYAAMIGVVAAYLGARAAALGFLGTGLPSGELFLLRLMTAPKVVLYYLQILVSPRDSKLWIDPPLVRGPGQIAFWGGAIVLIGLVAGLIRLRRIWPQFHFGGWWLLLSLGPVSGLLRVAGARVAERWLYLPSMGFAVIVAAALGQALAAREERWQPARKGAWALLGVLLLCYVAFTLMRNPVWHDDLTLFREMAAQVPSDYRIISNYGEALLAAGHSAVAAGDTSAAVEYCGEAVREFQEATGLEPNSYKVRANLAVALGELAHAYALQGDMPAAIAEMEKVVRLVPDSVVDHVNLGRLYLETADKVRALQEAETALRLEPGNSAARELRKAAGG